MSDSAVRTRTDPRISRRRKAVARTKKRRTTVRALIAAGVALAVWVAFFSPLLAIKEITLSGAKRTTEDDVASVLGLDSSDNLLLLRTDEVAAAVKELPWVKSVSVDRKLPGTVKLTVTERSPAMAVALGEQHYLIDRRGRVLSPTESAEGLPRACRASGEPARPGGAAQVRATNRRARKPSLRSHAGCGVTSRRSSRRPSNASPFNCPTASRCASARPRRCARRSQCSRCC